MRSYGHLIRDITEEVMSERVAGESLLGAEVHAKDFHARNPTCGLWFKNEGRRYQQLERLLRTMLDRMSNPLSVSLLFFFSDAPSEFWSTESMG